MNIIKAIFLFIGIIIALDVAWASMDKEEGKVETSASSQEPHSMGV